MEWFIQLHKKICEWEWYTDIPTKILFFHILLKCNYKEAKWRGKIIKPWEFITSSEHLALETWLTRQQVRTAIKKLESTWEITYKATNDYTILWLNNWGMYNQQDNQHSNQRITNKQPTNNQRITTTNKEYKEKREYKENNTDTLVAMQPNEYKLSIDYLKSYTLETEIPDYAYIYKDEWIKFCIYWWEKGKTWKIRAEWEKTFEIKKRFATWMSRKKESYLETQQPKRWVF